MSHMLSLVVDAVSDLVVREHGTESSSTQDTISTMDQLNKKEDKEDLVVFSTDVKGLFPNMQAEESVAIVARMVRESSLEAGTAKENVGG